MFDKNDLIELGRAYRQTENKEFLSKANSLSESLTLQSLICTDDTNTKDWVYNPLNGNFRYTKNNRSISPILYKFRSTELLEIKRFPFKADAKDFISDNSFDSVSNNIDLITPDTDFYLNTRELVHLLSQIEYDGVCNTLNGKAYLNVRFVSGRTNPFWLLSCDKEQVCDCIYIDGKDKSRGIKPEYYDLFPQLISRIDKIAENQRCEVSIDKDAADLAAYYRSL